MLIDIDKNIVHLRSGGDGSDMLRHDLHECNFIAVDMSIMGERATTIRVNQTVNLSRLY